MTEGLYYCVYVHDHGAGRASGRNVGTPGIVRNVEPHRRPFWESVADAVGLFAVSSTVSTPRQVTAARLYAAPAVLGPP